MQCNTGALAVLRLYAAMVRHTTEEVRDPLAVDSMSEPTPESFSSTDVSGSRASLLFSVAIFALGCLLAYQGCWTESGWRSRSPQEAGTLYCILGPCIQEYLLGIFISAIVAAAMTIPKSNSKYHSHCTELPYMSRLRLAIHTRWLSLVQLLCT